MKKAINKIFQIWYVALSTALEKENWNVVRQIRRGIAFAKGEQQAYLPFPTEENQEQEYLDKFTACNFALKNPPLKTLDGFPIRHVVIAPQPNSYENALIYVVGKNDIGQFNLGYYRETDGGEEAEWRECHEAGMAGYAEADRPLFGLAGLTSYDETEPMYDFILSGFLK